MASRLPPRSREGFHVGFHFTPLLTLSPLLTLTYIYSQTPTLNAAPVVRAVLEACKTGGPNRTGIQVTLFLDLGFNDKGESVPFQGGTNEVSCSLEIVPIEAHTFEVSFQGSCL